MLIKKIVVCLLCISYLVNSQAQTEKELNGDKNAFSRLIQKDKLAIKVNYFGELGLHPGLEIGTDYTIAKRNWVTIHWDTGLGGYWHRWNNTSLFAKTSIGARFPISSFFIDLNAGVGYMHSFLAGDVYKPSSKGGVEKGVDMGTSHFMPNFSLLVGWDMSRKNKGQFTFHIGPEIYLQSNFNHIFLPHVAANIGLTYNFKK